MISFGRAFKQLFKVKSKDTYEMFMFQLGAAVIGTIVSFLSKDTGSFGSSLSGIFILFIVTFLGLSSIAHLIFLIDICRKSEKFNRSQTWRLMPISSSKFYLVNIFTSLISYLYLFALEIIFGLVGALISYLSSGKVREIIAMISKQFKIDDLHVNWFSGFELIIAILLFGLFVFIIVGFYHFSYRSIMDFLPGNKNKLLLIIVRIITLVAVIYILYLAVQTVGHLTSLADAIWTSSQEGTYGMIVVIFALMDLIFGGASLWLFNKFIEAKAN